MFPEIESFDSNASRVKKYEQWRELREQWADSACEAAKSRKLYDKLYALYSELERQRDLTELMVGDGLLEATLPDGTKVCHPLVLERVVLVFDSGIPCFTVRDSDSAPLLYTRLLRGIPELESACLSEYSALIENESIHPFEGQRFNNMLAGFANALSSECDFVDAGTSSKAKFTIRRGPVLFTRSKASGYGAILDKIIADIENGGELAPSLLSIIGANDQGADDAELVGGSSAMEVNGLDSSVLLEKSANREQLIIARKLARCPAVLVQGPPGTGKTHTISNIIGDLLAQGKSVLVTSQTSKALSVLRDKISEPVRPLCVSVLDNNRRQLEDSLTAINDYMSAHNVESLDADGDRLQRERTALIESLSLLRGELLTLVGDQYSPISVDNKTFAPKEAAQFITSLDDTAFIPDEAALDAELPLSPEQVLRLYDSNGTLSAEEEAFLLSGAPDRDALIQPSAMRRICEMLSREAVDDDTYAALWDSNAERHIDAIAAVREQINVQRSRIASAEPWMLDVARTGGSSQNSIYESISELLPRMRALSDELRLVMIDSKPMIPAEIVSAETGNLFNEIYSELENEKINWLTIALHPKWKQLLDRCLINGEKPDTRSEVGTLCKLHSLMLDRQALLRRWDNAVVALGGPALTGEQPEEQAAPIWNTVLGWLCWFENDWTPVTEQLSALGFRYEQYLESLPLQTRMAGGTAAALAALDSDLPDIIEAEYYRGDRTDCTEQLLRASRELLPYCEQFPVAAQLRSAIEMRSAEQYAAAFDQYDVVCMKRALCDERQQLLDRLAVNCPLWSAQIRKREGANGGNVLPDSLDEHWLRARLKGELHRRCGSAVSDIQRDIEKQTAQLSVLTRDLIAARAWSAQLRTMRDQSKKRSLAEWAELVKRVGKGTGKRAEQLRSSGELRRAMKNCRRAVPVWIMPLSEVAEYFEPSDEKFDVLIIDEASQADLTALISLYLAKKVLVVGDDKQVSPTPIGLDIDTSAKLRQEFLSDIPAAAMYDEMVSIYDIAKANYEPITLREHFRCADDIINYSNYYTYNGIICPLRDSRSIRLHPSTVAYHVPDGAIGSKKTNPREAVTVAALIAACTEQPEYRDSTFGVITMTGDAQALLVDRILREKLTESCYQSRRILCGNPSYFQGDERDVVFISLVDCGNDDGRALTVRRDGYNEMYAKRYNVAASRARDQMWVVHSLNPETDLKSDDIRLGLIRHAEHPEETAAALEKERISVLTDMEQAVADALTDNGYRVVPRQKVGTYTIAIACEGDGGRIAIECDGDRTVDAEGIVAEINKQSVLERLGWRFVRLRATDYYLDADAFLKQMLKDIRESGLSPFTAETEHEEDTLLSRVKARADELLKEWETPTEEEVDIDDGDTPSDDGSESIDAEPAYDAAAADAQTAGNSDDEVTEPVDNTISEEPPDTESSDDNQ